MKSCSFQFLGKTHPGTVHDKRAVDETPYPLPQGSHLLQDLGFLGFKLERRDRDDADQKKPKAAS